MPLRETKDSAEYYEAVLSLKSTGLTYRTKQLSSLCSVCERDLFVENALEKKSRSSRSRALSYSSRFPPPPPLRFFQNHNERYLCALWFFAGVFTCVCMCLTFCSSFEPFFLFSSSRHKKSDYSFARARDKRFLFRIRRREEVKEEDKAHQK